MKNFGFVLARDRARSRSASTGGAMPMSVETRGSSAPTVSAIHAPNDMPAGPERRAGIARGHEVERRAEVVHLAGAFVEGARARADAAEVEAQHRAADARQRLRRLIHHLGVHRPAVLRMRMRRGRRRRGCRRRARARRRPSRVDAADRRRLVEQRFEAAGRSLDLTQHCDVTSAWRIVVAITRRTIATHVGERLGPRDRAEMAGALEHARRARRRSGATYSAVPSTGTTWSSPARR